MISWMDKEDVFIVVVTHSSTSLGAKVSQARQTVFGPCRSLLACQKNQTSSWRRLETNIEKKRAKLCKNRKTENGSSHLMDGPLREQYCQKRQPLFRNLSNVNGRQDSGRCASVRGRVFGVHNYVYACTGRVTM